MRYAPLGNSGIASSILGFGCMSLTGAYGGADRAGAIDAVHAALDAGVTFFDTADIYGNGENEQRVGEALRGVRNRVVLATKGGATRDAQGRATNDASPAHLAKACDASLARLGVDCVDLYYLHRVDPEVPIEESMDALARIVQQGKARAIGLSEVSAATLRRACAVHPVAALQTEYSLACRFAEDDILPACAELGVAFVAYGPLGRGLLTGTIGADTQLEPGDLRRPIPRFQGENLERNAEIARRLHEIAGGQGITAAQLALAWVLGRPWKPFAIPGTRSAARARHNAAAADVALAPEVVAQVDALFAGEPIRGERHTAHMLSRTGL